MVAFARRKAGSPLQDVGEEPDYRFTLANERTFLAWIRTSLAMMAAGVAVVQFVPGLDLLRHVLGLFLILPVFAVHAPNLRGGDNLTLVGVALGAYGLTQAILDRAPGAGTRKPRIDDGGALRVEDRVAVDVSQARHADRELHAQHVRCDFADVRTGRFLFLSACHGGAP